jgi:hypothetical protein
MNTHPLQEFKVPGFKIVPKRSLRKNFSSSQSAYYVLLRRRDSPNTPHERVMLVHYLDHFLEGCQRQIDELWEKHRVLITHVAVKVGRQWKKSHGDFTRAYRRALEIQHLRQELQPRFRRL